MSAREVHVTVEFFKGLLQSVRAFEDEADADKERARVGDWDADSDTGCQQHTVEVE